jgi:hypothetical protein
VVLGLVYLAVGNVSLGQLTRRDSMEPVPAAPAIEKSL